jgi:hypothetical protein
MKFFLFSSLSLLCLNSYAEKVSFNKDVLPILSDKCYFCHGPDAHDIKGKLQLHTFENATQERHYKTKSGKERQRDPAIIPGNIGDSLVWERIMTDDEDEIMPPVETHKPLSKKEKSIIKAWIEQGAEYEPHWSYTKIESDAKSIDQLAKAKLDEYQLDFNKEASKRTLIRRLSFDLRGVPPTPKEIKSFLNNQSPQAWSQLIDQFLASSEYGEKMAVYWLDLVRYADTVGYHGDQIQHVDAYRDYVIDAFNKNKKFDDFTREQLAGDLLPNPTQEHLIASAYNRLNMMSREGGAQAKEYLAKYAQDRVATTSVAWLGSTIACAECHDHKYDPFTAKDFYSFAAFFADIQEVGVYNKNPIDGTRLDNGKPFPPLLLLNKQDLDQKRTDLQANVTTQSEIKSKMLTASKFDQNELSALHNLKKELLNIAPTEKLKGKHTLTVVTKTKQLLVEFPAKKKNSAQVLKLIFRQNGKEVGVKKIYATTSDKHFNGDRLRTKHKDGWKFTSDKNQALLIDFKKEIQGELQVEVQYKWAPQHISNISALTGKTLTINDIKQLISNNPKSQKELYLRFNSKDFSQVYNKINELKQQINKLEKHHGKHVQITVPVKPRTMRILPRGNWQDDSGEVVQPAIPAFLGKIQKESPANRLDLANWIISKENPLTARAFTNRLWKQFFGRGLAADVTDLGAQGQAPENPELLNFISQEFKNNWDIKAIIKLIVSSKVYRQSSEADNKLLTLDPFNDFLAHQQSRRLEAEFIRDNALSISNLLLNKTGGSAAKPYQPVGYYKDLNFPRRTYRSDSNDQQYRRGVYMHRQRTYLHPMLKAFDAPSREQCIASRPISNTPLQALNLLNDPTFVEAAKSFAENTLKARSSIADRLQLMFEKCTGRLADAQEIAELTSFIERELSFYSKQEDKAKELLSTGLKKVDPSIDSKELAAWTSLARVLLNLHETITIY